MSRLKNVLMARSAPAIVHMSAYANNLTAVIPELYAGLDVVSRELVGLIPSVDRNSDVERAAVGQTVIYDIAPAQTPFDVVPAMSTPEPADFTTGSGSMTIQKARGVAFGWTGEEQRAVSQSGALGYVSIQANNFAQGLRALTNEMERDGCVAAALGASRAYGTAGTTPFASGVGDSAQLRKILDDNGAPQTGRSMVVNTAAGANIRTNTQLTKANEAGSVMTLRDGELLNVHGFSIKESAQIVDKVAGTAASATTNATGYAKGATVITLASAGTGTIVPGDVISFAGDTEKYVVVAGDTDVSNGGTITIAAPGLRKAIPAAATAITRSASFAANLGFSSNAINLATRAIALPREGDAAIDRTTLVDPRSGIAFEVALYAGYRKIRAEVSAAWGWGVIKSEHVALLLG